MAADKAAVASGADLGDGLRKRPINNGSTVPTAIQPEDNKKQVAKKVRLSACAARGISSELLYIR